MDIASIAADLSAALESGNTQAADEAQADYAAFLAEGVEVEDESVLSEDDDEILGEPDVMSVEPVSVEVADEDVS